MPSGTGGYVPCPESLLLSPGMRIVRYDWPTQQWGPKCEISDLAGGPSGGRGFPGLVAGCAAPRGAAGGCIWLFASAGEVYPLTFTSRLTTGQFTTNPLGPNGLPAGNPVTLPSATCCKAAEKSVWRRLRPAITAASVQVARWTSHIGL